MKYAHISGIVSALVLLAFCQTPSLSQTEDMTGIGISSKVFEGYAPPRSDNAPKDNTNRVKGTYIRTEIRDSKSTYRLVVSIAIRPENRQPTLKVCRQEIKTIAEVRIYEALLRTFSPGADENHGTYDYQRLEGETWEGDKSFRTENLPPEPMKDADVLVNGELYRTDAQGLLLDPENRLKILETFDNLSTRILTLVVDVPGFDPVVFPMKRTMPERQKNDDLQIDEDVRQELLPAYRLNFKTSKTEPEQKALQCTLVLPDRFAYAEAGKPFPVTLKVTNNGAVPTSCLVAGSFSRIAGLNGKLFYFGAIPPGETYSFTRIMVVDSTEKANSAAMEIRFSDSWGTPAQKLPVSFTVIH